jgi:hypothetical protein
MEESMDYVNAIECCDKPHLTTACQRTGFTAPGRFSTAGCVSSQTFQMGLSAPDAARHALHTSGTASRLQVATDLDKHTPMKRLQDEAPE